MSAPKLRNFGPHKCGEQPGLKKGWYPHLQTPNLRNFGPHTCGGQKASQIPDFAVPRLLWVATTLDPSREWLTRVGSSLRCQRSSRPSRAYTAPRAPRRCPANLTVSARPSHQRAITASTTATPWATWRCCCPRSGRAPSPGWSATRPSTTSTGSSTRAVTDPTPLRSRSAPPLARSGLLAAPQLGSPASSDRLGLLYAQEEGPNHSHLSRGAVVPPSSHAKA